MDERLMRTIERLASWGELAQLESNIRTKGALSEAVVAALKARSDEFGLAYVVEMTGIVLQELSPAERKIVAAIGEYAAIKKREKSNANRTLDQVRRLGLIDAAEVAVSKSRPTQGYRVLADADLEDLSYERIVVDHPDEFSPRALWYSRRTLGEANATEKPPASTHSDVHTRTLSLLAWLQGLADENDEYLPSFSNAEAATSIGLGSLRNFARVHGNIQSRVDFACFKADLPPLGCAAIEVFERAWSQDERDWKFAVRELQLAVQGRRWSRDDFTRVVAECATLPGIAHLPWRDALTKDERKVREWAERWAREGLRLGAPSRDHRHLERLPADILAKATPEFIWNATQLFRNGKVVHPFGHSTDFDLIDDNGGRHPPKAVFGIALSMALNGRSIEPKHFSGGEGSACFRLLREANCLIVPKGKRIDSTQDSDEDKQEWDEGRPRLLLHRQRERGRGMSAAKRPNIGAFMENWRVNGAE